MLCMAILLAPVVHDDVSLARESVGQTPDTSIVFMGDVMLARAVERRMDAEGSAYPFAHIHDALQGAAVVANFEAAVPDKHRPTPDFGMRFSVRESYLRSLAEAGITHVSLANNHAYDFGAAAFQNTRAALKDAGVAEFGHPYQLGTSSVAYIETEHATVAVVGIYGVDRIPKEAAIETVFRVTSAQSEVQVAYVHWGNEYELLHSGAQERLARSLIEHGADAVIGHHPHVVQDIAVYEGAPIFYSLGNFVFDQYFSTDVQQGLMVRMTVDAAHRIAFQLVPITSVHSRNAPRVMDVDASVQFLDRLAAHSDELLGDMIRGGTVAIGQ